MTPEKGERIAKIIARAGLCSRRDAEKLIAEGRVSLNGKVLASPAVTVLPKDSVMVDGKALPQAAPARLWRYHKPRGLITSARDPEGRPTIFDNLPPGLPRLQPVGRLDLNSEGLLLLTNSGELKRHLELPATAMTRRYRVRVFGRLDEARLNALSEGITIEGFTFGPIEAEIERRNGSNAWLIMSLQEGKNREIRSVCQHLGLQVNRLIRLSYGPFELGDLPSGELRSVPASQLAGFLSTGEKSERREGFAKARLVKGKRASKGRPKKGGADKSHSAKQPSPKAQAVKPARATKTHEGKAGAHAHRRRTP